MKNVVESISSYQVKQDMELWKSSSHSTSEEYETLWKMFRAVVLSSSYGTSEYGGPVWLMDFSIENLKRFYPYNAWLHALERKKLKINGQAEAEELILFSRWFEERADAMITTLGLGNVMVKVEAGVDNVSLYANSLFLDIVQEYVRGTVDRLTKGYMLRHFSLKDSVIVMNGEFPTRLGGVIVNSFPTTDVSCYFVRNKVGEFYLLKNWEAFSSDAVERAIGVETIKEKFLILLVNDLMEAKARNEILSSYDYVEPQYPKMKYEKYLDLSSNSFKPTVNVFEWPCQGNESRKIKIRLPRINPKYGEFWHRKFPLKQNWRMKEV